MAEAPDTTVLIHPLVAALMTASMMATAAETDQVINALQYRAARAEAELDLVRQSVSTLLEGPYMPMPDALRNALWPARETIDEVLGETEED